MDGRNAAHIAYKAALTTAHSERVPSLSRKRYVPVVYAYVVQHTQCSREASRENPI